MTSRNRTEQTNTLQYRVIHQKEKKMNTSSSNPTIETMSNVLYNLRGGKKRKKKSSRSTVNKSKNVINQTGEWFK